MKKDVKKKWIKVSYYTTMKPPVGLSDMERFYPKGIEEGESLTTPMIEIPKKDTKQTKGYVTMFILKNENE